MWFLNRPIVWLRRITHCRGFGIQSPTDYWFVRYVINESWPYYQYETLGLNDNWLDRKLGRLYFRIANWRQPSTIDSSRFREYFHAGCNRAVFTQSTELVRLVLEGDYQNQFRILCENAKDDTVLIVEGIDKNQGFWDSLTGDERVRVTFDLYYCGIVLFDKRRYKQNYIINF